MESFSLSRSYQNLAFFALSEPSDSKVWAPNLWEFRFGQSRHIPNRQREHFRGKASVFFQSFREFLNAQTLISGRFGAFSPSLSTQLYSIKLFSRFRQLDHQATWPWGRTTHQLFRLSKNRLESSRNKWNPSVLVVLTKISLVCLFPSPRILKLDF